ncbi:hypothetical protein [Bacillus cereus]|uniref:hypothetical protein n=1 Tax=Bacillus cereus TaxID=1396 RepID=UPI00156AF198|nr:hypothetical protein [Bacillus cereus]NRS77421.1 hypothetical protein [Bacillus cereus]
MIKWKSEYSVSNFIAILLTIIFSIVFFYISELLPSSTIWKAILSNIGAALLISGVFTGFNEYFMKDKLVEMIFAKLKLKEDIQKTGIDETILDWAKVDYGYYIKNAKNTIDVFQTYGETWTKMNQDHFVSSLLNSDCKIRVFLMSPDSKFLPALADQYGKTPEELKATIERVKKLWEDIYERKSEQRERATQSELHLYFHDLLPSRSIYRMDDKVIVVDTTMMKGRSSKLPVLICSNTKKTNDFYDYYVNELDQLVLNAKEQSLIKL